MSGIDFNSLIASVGKYSDSVQAQISQMGASSAGSAGGLDITAMFSLQLAMNKLSQFSTAVTNVMAAQNQANQSIAQNIK